MGSEWRSKTEGEQVVKVKCVDTSSEKRKRVPFCDFKTISFMAVVALTANLGRRECMHACEQSGPRTSEGVPLVTSSLQGSLRYRFESAFGFHQPRRFSTSGRVRSALQSTAGNALVESSGACWYCSKLLRIPIVCGAPYNRYQTLALVSLVGVLYQSSSFSADFRVCYCAWVYPRKKANKRITTLSNT